MLIKFFSLSLYAIVSARAFQPSVEHGIWSHSLIDSYISRGFHPTRDQISLLDANQSSTYGSVNPPFLTLRDYVIGSVDAYLTSSLAEYMEEERQIKTFTDDISPLLTLENLNARNVHRGNTLLHLYCRAPEIFVGPIVWLQRFGADPDQPNQWTITPRDLLKERGLEILIEGIDV